MQNLLTLLEEHENMQVGDNISDDSENVEVCEMLDFQGFLITSFIINQSPSHFRFYLSFISKSFDLYRLRMLILPR